MSKKYLDDAGLNTLANEIVAHFQRKLTFDSTPTQNSQNPVTSGGVYNAINTPNIATCSFSKHASCVAGNTDYLADRELTIDMGYIKAPQGTLVTLLSFNRTMHYLNDTYLDGSGNYVLYLYINGEQKAAVSNYMGSKKACNMDVITCQFEATGGNDLLSIKLYSGTATRRVMFVSSINAAFAKDVEITQIEH